MDELEIQQKVIELFSVDKLSLYKIQKTLHIDYHKVRRILSANGFSFPQKKVKLVDEDEVVRLYEIEKYTLRMVSKALDIDHHRVARILEKYNITVTTVGRKRAPFTEEHRRKISESSKGRESYWKNKKMPKSSLYKNMKAHLKWDIDLDFLLQFEDVEKLKTLNKILTRDRVSKHFDVKKYKLFIKKFYFDEQFNRIYKDYIYENKQKYSKPSLDHIIPLAKGGSWNLDNLQILNWAENRAKCDFLPEEWEYIKNKYFQKEASKK
jgi:hypothetical protein